MFFAERDGASSGAGVLRALEKDVGRIRRRFRRLAGSLPALRDAVGVRPRRERQHRFHRRDRPRGLRRRIRAGPGLRLHLDRGRTAGPLQPCSKTTARFAQHYVKQWSDWQSTLLTLDQPPRQYDLYRTSTAVLRTHESKDFLGGIIASLSIPWGFNKGDEDLGGYHLVWPRDLVETAGALAGRRSRDRRGARPALSGSHAGSRRQLGAESLARWPSLLERRADGRDRLPHPAARSAAPRGSRRPGQARPLVAHGAQRGQLPGAQRSGHPTGSLGGRWRIFAIHAGRGNFRRCWPPPTLPTLPGTPSRRIPCATPPTPGTTTSSAGSTPPAATWRSNSASKATTCASPRRTADGAASPTQGFVPIKNRPPGQDRERAYHIISPDALALVRFGLRAPDDPPHPEHHARHRRAARRRAAAGPVLVSLQRRRLRRTQRRFAPSTAPASAAPGRCWRASAPTTRLAGGHRDEAEALLTVMENSTTGHSRLLPEQVWDAADIPALELFRGKPSGSACPLVWAHSEYIKLRRSIRDGKIFDQPPQTVQRYLVEKHGRQHFGWRLNNKTRTVPPQQDVCASCCFRRRWCTGASTAGKPPRHQNARHRSGHLYAQPAHRVVSPRRSGRLHFLLAGRKPLGGHRLHGHGRGEVSVGTLARI